MLLRMEDSKRGEGGKERICKLIHVKSANEHEIRGVVSK